MSARDRSDVRFSVLNNTSLWRSLKAKIRTPLGLRTGILATRYQRTRLARIVPYTFSVLTVKVPCATKNVFGVPGQEALATEKRTTGRTHVASAEAVGTAAGVSKSNLLSCAPSVAIV